MIFLHVYKTKDIYRIIKELIYRQFIQKQSHMDAQLQAMRAHIIDQIMPIIENQRAHIINQLMPVIQNQKTQLQFNIDQLDNNRKNQQRGLHLKLQELRQQINKVNQGRKEEERNLDMEIKRIRNRVEKDFSQEINKLKAIHQEQEELVRDLAERLKQVGHEDPHRIHNEEMELKIKNIVDRNSACINKFIIDDETGRVEKMKGTWEQLLGNILIAQKPINELKIFKTKHKNINLGIIDRKYINDQDSFTLKTKEWIYYRVWDGSVYESCEKMADGKKVEQGETVSMKVEGKTIYWRVGKQVRAKHTTPMLKDKSINWVPWIRMCDKGDIVEWK